MLKYLFGNKSVERVLLFLLINEQCYAHQLQYLLNLPLSPIQNALIKLEKGKILISQINKKSRIYSFNPNCPLVLELETLLKKAYIELPVEEKKQYHFVNFYQKVDKKYSDGLLGMVWKSLSNVTQMTLFVQSKKNGEKATFKRGKGGIIIDKKNATITFTEQGIWQEDGCGYYNSYRFTLNRMESMITLEHLRRGENNPIFLFHLIPTKKNILESMHPHLCNKDTYFGCLQIKDLFLHLRIRTIGPSKNERIEYAYA